MVLFKVLFTHEQYHVNGMGRLGGAFPLGPSITRPKLAKSGDVAPFFGDSGVYIRNLEVRLDPLERGRDNLSIKYSWTSNGLRM